MIPDYGNSRDARTDGPADGVRGRASLAGTLITVVFIVIIRVSERAVADSAAAVFLVPLFLGAACAGLSATIGAIRDLFRPRTSPDYLLLAILGASGDVAAVTWLVARYVR